MKLATEAAVHGDRISLFEQVGKLKAEWKLSLIHALPD